jgi:hypothetical protein
MAREVTQQFPTAQSAKDFLAGKVIEQAGLVGVTLSVAERKMMYYSADEPTVANEVAEQFSDYDPEYEKKIASLLRQSYANDPEKEIYRAAFEKLAEGDHYLSVMAAPGCASGPSSFLGPVGKLMGFLNTPTDSQSIKERSGRDIALLFISAIAVIGVMLLFEIYWQPAKEAFWRWFSH